jgi:DNA invertase Pin-like site-specific DNA recombinase
MKTQRVAFYARVSTFAGQNPEMQLVELREYAARRGWQLTEEYVDHGVSGAKESRPALNRLMADAKQRKFDVVAVWKLDRFGRSVAHVVVALAELEALGITFVSLKDNLDLSTPSGRFMFQIVAAFAELERAMIQERVRAGLLNAKRKGKRLGRPPAAVDKARIARLSRRSVFTGHCRADRGLSGYRSQTAPRVLGNPLPFTVSFVPATH